MSAQVFEFRPGNAPENRYKHAYRGMTLANDRLLHVIDNPVFEYVGGAIFPRRLELPSHCNKNLSSKRPYGRPACIFMKQILIWSEVLKLTARKTGDVLMKGLEGSKFVWRKVLPGRSECLIETDNKLIADTRALRKTSEASRAGNRQLVSTADMRR